MMNIVLFGCCGRMGTAVSNLVDTIDNAQIVLGVDKFPKLMPYPVQASIDESIAADVMICYMRPTEEDDILNMLAYTIRKNIPLVMCTTALSAECNDAISNAAQSIPVFYSANMSLGVAMLSRLLKQISAPLYNAAFDIEIVEKHHAKKLDAPSGTALMLADTIKNAIQEPISINTNRTAVKAERRRNEIGVQAIRGGTIVGEHSITFAGQFESIEITHSAQSRDVFAVGTLHAARFVVGKPAGLYSMEDIV